jgi:hypothetical protein
MRTDLVQAALVMAVALRTNLVRSVGRAAVPNLASAVVRFSKREKFV